MVVRGKWHVEIINNKVANIQVVGVDRKVKHGAAPAIGGRVLREERVSNLEIMVLQPRLKVSAKVIGLAEGGPRAMVRVEVAEEEQAVRLKPARLLGDGLQGCLDRGKRGARWEVGANNEHRVRAVKPDLGAHHLWERGSGYGGLFIGVRVSGIHVHG